jgi:hypothetical protein
MEVLAYDADSNVASLVMRAGAHRRCLRLAAIYGCQRDNKQLTRWCRLNAGRTLIIIYNL